MSKQPYKILQTEIFKSRVSQNLTHEAIDQLVSNLQTHEIQKIIKVILINKNLNKRTNIDNYILMKSCQIFQYFREVLINKGQKPLFEVCKHLNYSKYNKQEYVFKSGQNADKIYIVMNGEVIVHILYKQKVVDENDKQITIQKIKQATIFKKGMIFGEASLKQNSRRGISVFTMTECQLFQIKKRDYELINKYIINSVMRQRYLFFDCIELFSKLSKPNLQSLMYLTQIKQISINHILYKEDEQIDFIYIIKSGLLKLQKSIKYTSMEQNQVEKLKYSKNKAKKVQTTILGERQVLGDVEIFKNRNRQQTCMCITQTAQVYRIKKKDFAIKFFEDKNNDEIGMIDYIVTKEHFKYNRINQLKNQFCNNKLLLSLNQTQIQRNPKKTKRSSPQNITQIDLSTMSKILNRQYEQQLQTQKKKKSLIISPKKIMFRSQKNNNFLSSPDKKYIPFSYKYINEIVDQKLIYSSLRPTNKSPVFKFVEMPIYFKKKLNQFKNKKRYQNQHKFLKTDISQTTHSRKITRSEQKISVEKSINQMSTTKKKTNLPYRNVVTPQMARKKYLQTMVSL